MAREKLADIFSWESMGEPLSRAVSTGIKNTVWEVEREINKSLAQNFFLPEKPEKRSHIWFGQKNGKIFSAELVYDYASIPLSRYPVSQHRITVGKQILSVKRGGNFARRGSAFEKKIVQDEIISTYVQIRRNAPPKLVEGVQGFKGWLHTGRRRGAVGFYGQRNLFSAHIFERNQKKTWSGGQRLPVHALWGPSITQLLQTVEMKSAVDRILLKAALEEKINEAFKKGSR